MARDKQHPTAPMLTAHRHSQAQLWIRSRCWSQPKSSAGVSQESHSKLHMHRYPTSPTYHRMLRVSQSGVIFGVGDLGATSTTLPSAVYLHCPWTFHIPMYYLSATLTPRSSLSCPFPTWLLCRLVYVTVAWVKSPGPRFSCAQVAKARLWALVSLVFAALACLGLTRLGNIHHQSLAGPNVM